MVRCGPRGTGAAVRFGLRTGRASPQGTGRATLIAVPGCYPTASILALGPFLDAELIERHGIVVNALSGPRAPVGHE